MFRPARWLEDRPTLHGLFVGALLLGLFAALLLVSGCSGGTEDQEPSSSVSVAPREPALDAPGRKACDKFARWLADGSDRATRVTVAKAVDTLASTSHSGTIADKAELLASSNVTQSDENFALAADSFAYECQDLGWKP